MIEVNTLKTVSLTDVLVQLKIDNPQIPNLYYELWDEISSNYYSYN